MNHKKKYLKYKQKYLYLKNQHGGVLLDDITKLVPIIKELQDYGFQLEKDINCKLEEVIISVKEFHRSKMKEVEEEKQKKEQLAQETILEDLSIEIIQKFWVYFYKTVCDTITDYHHIRDIIYATEKILDNTLEIRVKDLSQKLQEVNNLLIEKWNYYLPPLLSDIIFSDSKLKREMLMNDEYRDRYNVPLVVPQYGYINPPLLNKLVLPYTYDELISELTNREFYYYYDEFLIKNQVSLEDKNINDLLRKYSSMSYANILELFKKKNTYFVNFNPAINEDSVRITDLEQD